MGGEGVAYGVYGMIRANTHILAQHPTSLSCGHENMLGWMRLRQHSAREGHGTCYT